MLLSIANSAKGPLLGLQALLLADGAGGRRGGDNVVMRTLVASRRAVGGGEEHTPEDNDAACGEGEEEEEEGCCWVSYGRRCPSLRLPPPIPSLVRTANLPGPMPWAMRRTRTEDGSLVIREVPVARREYIRARRSGGRLILQLMERADRPVAPPQPPSEQGEDVGADDESAAVEASVQDVQTAAQPQMLRMTPPAAVARPALVCMEGCFEDVMRSMSSNRLHQVPASRLRMVH